MSVYRMPLHHLLYEMDATGGNQKRLFDFPVTTFAWSPDGQKLMYISAYEDPEHNDPAVLKGSKRPLSAIYVLDLKTRNQKRLTSFGQNCSGSWSPDGSQLALSFGTEQSSNIFTATSDGKSVRRLTNSDIINLNPKWSPDGKFIAFISVDTGEETEQTPGVNIMDADGTNQRRVSDIAAYDADWSLDGTSLLIQSAAGLTLMELEGKSTIALAPKIGRPLDAIFTPDGQEVVFRSDHEGSWHLYAVDLSGSNVRRITGRLTASTFCFSPLGT